MAHLKCGVDQNTVVVQQPASSILQTKQGLMKRGTCHIRALLALSHTPNPCLPTQSYCHGSLCPTLHGSTLQTQSPGPQPSNRRQINSPGCANTGKSPAPSGRNLTAHVNTHHPQSSTATPRETEMRAVSRLPG